MKYMLLIYGNEAALDDATRQACYAESAGVARELAREGKFVATAPLQPVATAASVRIKDGKTVVTDGPFAETREQLGGFFMVNADSMDEAIAIAQRLPGGKFGTVEVRPIVEISGVPEF